MVAGKNTVAVLTSDKSKRWAARSICACVGLSGLELDCWAEDYDEPGTEEKEYVNRGKEVKSLHALAADSPDRP